MRAAAGQLGGVGTHCTRTGHLVDQHRIVLLAAHEGVPRISQLALQLRHARLRRRQRRPHGAHVLHQRARWLLLRWWRAGFCLPLDAPCLGESRVCST
jgi:hypothetical protein